MWYVVVCVVLFVCDRGLCASFVIFDALLSGVICRVLLYAFVRV